MSTTCTIIMNLLFALFFTLQLAAAVPITIRDVYTPPVTSPDSESKWTIGQRYNVTWNTSSPPDQISNPSGMILLRKDDLTINPITLASNFSILLGSMEVEVPSVPAASDYRIVLFGDSGNWSPEFNISD